MVGRAETYVVRLMTRRGIRRHPKVLVAGVIAVIVVVASLIGNLIESNRNSGRAAYAGTYVARSLGERLVLHDDGTWTRYYGRGSGTGVNGECSAGGAIIDSCWEVVSAHEACGDCQNPPRFRNFGGDRAVFIPTRWARRRGAQVISLWGDYYGIVRKGHVLRDEAGHRWVR